MHLSRKLASVAKIIGAAIAVAFFMATPARAGLMDELLIHVGASLASDAMRNYYVQHECRPEFDRDAGKKRIMCRPDVAPGKEALEAKSLSPKEQAEIDRALLTSAWR